MAVLTKPSVKTHAPPRRPPPRDLDWGAAGWAGIAGAFVLIALETGPLFFSGDSWRPVRMVAEIVFKFMPTNNPSAFNIALAALAVHLPLSLIYARLLALLIYDRRTGPSLVIGVSFGLVIYLINFYVFTALFPWFAGVRGMAEVADHAAFGLATAWVYQRLQGRVS